MHKIIKFILFVVWITFVIIISGCTFSKPLLSVRIFKEVQQDSITGNVQINKSIYQNQGRGGRQILDNTQFFQNKLLVKEIINSNGIIYQSDLTYKPKDNKAKSIKIEWVNDLDGDFSFVNQWSYPEGIYRDEFGVLLQDGISSDIIETLKDSTGSIAPESLTYYYTLVDTNHLYHTISGESNCYEWVGTDFVDVFQDDKHQIVCKTQTTVGTHSSLVITIDKNDCSSKIELYTISSPSLIVFYGISGNMKIDKKYWKNGILKCEFEFYFVDPAKPDTPIFWKGKIYKKII
ncbi:MAG: hypothetical protein H6Q25_1047 [Bacteroidetes bacterium]|nr:hypothetical protein [Bacteroidota bacterium]